MKNTLLLFLLFIVSCTTAERRQFPNDTRTIDIQTAFEQPLGDFAQFVDSSWFVALSSPMDNAQGYITKIIVHQDKIYTLDELQSRTLNVYNIKGDFLYSLAPRGKGPREALNITDFSVYGNEVFVNDILQKRIQVFNTEDGAFIRTMQLPFSNTEFKKLSDNRYLFVLSPYNEDLGEQYQTNTVLITDSTLLPVKLQITRPAADMESVGRSLWNLTCGSNSIFSIFSECLYAYNPQADSVQCVVGFDYGSDNIPDKLRKDYRAYMNHFENKKTVSLTTESPIVCGKYIVGLISDGDSKYVMLDDGGQTYTRKIVPEQYNVKEPLFPIGIMNDSVLISYVEPSVGIQQLIDMGEVINGVKVTADNTLNVLLFSKLKE